MKAGNFMDNNNEKRPLTLSEVMRLIAAQLLNDIVVDDSMAIRMTQFYPRWEDFINEALYVGNKVQYAGKLWKVLQTVKPVLEHQPPGAGTEALYAEIDESHAGTIDDPIPYSGNMALENGKYYIQDEVIYHCFRDTVNPVYNPLSDLVGLYVELVNNENDETPVDDPKEPETPDDEPGENEEKPVEESEPGTLENPIEFEQGMIIYNGKYYSQNDVIYLCNRDSGNGLYFDLSALIGLYVEVIDNGNG